MGKPLGFFKGFLGGVRQKAQATTCRAPAWRKVRAASIQGGAGGEDVVQEENPLPGHLGRVGRCVDPGHVGPLPRPPGSGDWGGVSLVFSSRGTAWAARALAVSWASSCAWS
ncbi:MAG: hypothetical protein ACLT9P_02315 [Evtepia gabavorous]